MSAAAASPGARAAAPATPRERRIRAARPFGWVSCAYGKRRAASGEGFANVQAPQFSLVRCKNTTGGPCDCAGPPSSSPAALRRRPCRGTGSRGTGSPADLRGGPRGRRPAESTAGSTTRPGRAWPGRAISSSASRRRASPPPRRRSSRSCTTTTPCTSPSAPSTIPRPSHPLLSRRDRFPGDWIEVNIDSYADRRTGSRSPSACPAPAATSSSPRTATAGTRTGTRSGKARRRSTAEGWTAEMRIPFSQLRFSGAPEQTWGLQVQRRIFRQEERSTWQVIPKASTGWVSQFGELRGIRGLKPRARRELLPYVVAKAERFEEEAGNPFRDGGLRGHVGRPRREARPHLQPHRRLHPEPGLRPGRSRSLGGQPHRLRDLLRGEAAVLHRGQRHLRGAPRARDPGQPLHPRPPVLLAPHRRRAAALARARWTASTRTSPRTSSDPGRGQAHRQDRGRPVRRRAGQRHRPRDTRTSTPSGCGGARRRRRSPTSSSGARSRTSAAANTLLRA